MTDKILEALEDGLKLAKESVDLVKSKLAKSLEEDTVKRIEEAIKLYKSNKPIAHAWFHRGMVNFDAEPELVLLDCAGKPIPLYVIPLSKEIKR